MQIPAYLPNEEDVDFEYKKQAVQYWQSGKRKPLSLTSVQWKYRKVISGRQLRRWKLQIEAGGDRKTILHGITTYVLQKVNEAIESHRTHRWIQIFKKKNITLFHVK